MLRYYDACTIALPSSAAEHGGWLRRVPGTSQSVAFPPSRTTLHTAAPFLRLWPADFAAEHGIVCDTEKISIDYVNTAMERLVKSDVHYRCAGGIGGGG